MYKIAVLGDYDSIYGFATLGLDTYPAYDPTEAVRSQRLPAIILIPGVSGNTGRGIAEVKRSVEQAVGSDIIFGNDN